jgi:hypothetical protein
MFDFLLLFIVGLKKFGELISKNSKHDQFNGRIFAIVHDSLWIGKSSLKPISSLAFEDVANRTICHALLCAESLRQSFNRHLTNFIRHLDTNLSVSNFERSVLAYIDTDFTM